jgi:hypothetical protein
LTDSTTAQASPGFSCGRPRALRRTPDRRARLLRVIGDADLDLPGTAHPFVAAGVLQIAGMLLMNISSVLLILKRNQRLAVAHERRFDDARRRAACRESRPAPRAGRVFGTRASAIERFSVGENVPLVTSPSPTPL